jgi:hypothetical protein
MLTLEKYTTLTPHNKTIVLQKNHIFILHRLISEEGDQGVVRNVAIHYVEFNSTLLLK